MGIFDNDDDFFNNDDFMNRWEKFNNRMMNDEEFRKEMERAHKDFQELMRMLLSPRNFGTPLDFRIIPLNQKDEFKTDFEIPNNEMDVEKGEDENGEWESKNWTSPDGSISYSSFSRSSGFDMNDIPDEIAERWGQKLKNKSKPNPEELKKLKLTKLQKVLNYEVQRENYEKAAEIKKLMDEIKAENKEE